MSATLASDASAQIVDKSLDETLRRMLAVSQDLDVLLRKEPEIYLRLRHCAEDLVTRAVHGREPEALLDFHRALGRLLALRTSPHRSRHEWSVVVFEIEALLSTSWLDYELDRLEIDEAAVVSPEGFQRWFAAQIRDNPAVDHPVFSYLEKEGTREDFAHFIGQERTIDLPFADFLSLMQVGAAADGKWEIAKNYWDEYGCGDPSNDHCAMFHRNLAEMGVDPDDDAALTWSARACGNISFLLALRRSLYPMSAGFLALLEVAVPHRIHRVLAAARRLELSKELIHYYSMHVEVDVGHGGDWITGLVLPAIERDPAVGIDIARGALLRQRVAEDYCDELLAHFRSTGQVAHGN